MITFYKPNKSNKGSLATFKVVAKQTNQRGEYQEGCVFLSIVKQTGWDAATQKGSFKGGEQLNIKLTATEIASIISLFERGNDFSTVHRSSSGNVSISFAKWIDKASGEHRGFGFFATKEFEGQKNSFSIGFRLGEDVQLREFLKFSLEHIFTASYSEDKRRAKEQFEKRSQEAENQQKKTFVEDALVEDEDPLF